MADEIENLHDGNQSSHGEGERQEISGESGLSRRDMIKLTAQLAVAAPLVGSPLMGMTAAGAEQTSKKKASEKRTPEKSAPLFFTREEFQLVDELTELIIPADDHSPGARAARVAAYIDGRLAESFEEEPKQIWRAGLKMIDSISQEMHGRAFLKATEDERIALLARISQNEMKPEKPEEHFFKELKARTVRAYYTSKIGIHTEIEYKGNTYLKEFVGYDAT